MNTTHKSTMHFLPILISVLTSMVALLLGCLVSAWFITQETVEMDALGYLGMGVLFLSGITGGILTLIQTKSKLLLTGCIVAITIFCVILSAGAIFFEEPLSGIGQTLLLVIGATVATILVGTHRKDPVRNHSRRRRTG